LTVIRKYIPEWIKEPYRRIRAKLSSIGLASIDKLVQPEEEVKASNDFSVVIAIHDSPNVTRRCLESVEKYGANAEVILVDDGSQLHETADLIFGYKQRNNWKVIRNNEPIGHSRSCEAGSRLVTRSYICFLNSDTVISPWSWAAAKEAFDSNPRIAVTGPSTSRTATQQTIKRADYCRHYWTNDQIYAFAHKYISNRPPKIQINLPFVGGFAFFIRSKLWNEFGGFDRNLPDYGNEVELCKRLKKRGFHIVWTQNSYIHHFGKGSYGQILNPDMMNKKGSEISTYINNLHRKQT